jgi:hypothetical protein
MREDEALSFRERRARESMSRGFVRFRVVRFRVLPVFLQDVPKAFDATFVGLVLSDLCAMGDTPSRPAAARPGAPTVGGTSLEAALAEIEEERARAANLPPPGVSGPPEIELRAVESDEAMARRLQSEEDAMASATPHAVTPAYYPTNPYAAPRRYGSPAHAQPPSSVGRDLMDVNSVTRPNHFPIPETDSAQRGDYAHPVPHGSFPYGQGHGYQSGVTGIVPPHLVAPEDDAALARRLQAEEDALARAPGSARLHPRDPHDHHADAHAEDAILARRLQDEEDAASVSAGEISLRDGGGAASGLLGDRAPSSSARCPGCGSPVGYFSQHVRTATGRWHTSCFVCAGCARGISSGTHVVKDGFPYHADCYRERFHPRCSVCAEKIPWETGSANDKAGPSSGVGVVRWLSHPYWCDSQYCPAHEFDGTKKCDGCERIEARRAAAEGNGFAELPDGRFLCLECASTAVVDDDRDSAPLYDAVCGFMADLGLPLVKGGFESIARGSATDAEASSPDWLWAHRPPLRLVSRDVLDTADGEAPGDVGRKSRTRGACLFSEHFLKTVERVPRWDANFANGLIPVGFDERVVGRSEGEIVTDAVVVLYGLPAIAFGAVLAHECAHAYIRIRGGFPRLAPKVEEGLCQLVALLWVEDVATRGRLPRSPGKASGRRGLEAGAGEAARSSREIAGPSSNTEDPLFATSGDGWEDRNLTAMAGYVANQIRTDPSDVYGNGLRVALGAYRRFGLRAVVDSVRATGEFPTESLETEE